MRGFPANQVFAYITIVFISNYSIFECNRKYTLINHKVN